MNGEETIAGKQSEQDPEVKKNITPEVTLADVIEYFSSWFGSQKAVALCIRYLQILKLRVEERKPPLSGEEPSNHRRNTDRTQLSLTVKELQYAATVVIKATQATAFKDEIRVLSRTKEAEECQGKRPRNVTSLQKLDPFLDKDGVLWVGAV